MKVVRYWYRRVQKNQYTIFHAFHLTYLIFSVSYKTCDIMNINYTSAKSVIAKNGYFQKYIFYVVFDAL
jgi:hypothetical protein